MATPDASAAPGATAADPLTDEPAAPGEPDGPVDPAALVGLLAEPVRLRVFSAVALGATSLAEAGRAAGAGAGEVATAVRRLERGGLLTCADGHLRARPERFTEAARAASTRRAEPPESHGTGDPAAEALLRTFVRDGRLLRLPAQFDRRRTLLRHLAARTFAPDEAYDEPAVNDRLRAWTEHSGTDHVTVRRHLVDHGFLTRDAGVYRLGAAA
ncbi:DUF2087 domain-containing protein [Streptomyces sp. TRM70308]|uniref:DUF2087 domain-containing protein n=1 Tax=Streptomyces sp. TRM70308 TaxID=3131932 RepID=UPI003D092A23